MTQKQEIVNEAELKSKLEKIVEDDYTPPPTEEIPGLVESMLAHIGTLDFDLREILIYRTFITWFRKKIFSPELMRELVHSAISDQFIFYKIGEQGTNSVFQRTFSMLLLPSLLIRNRDQSYLTAEEVHLVKDKLIEYLQREKDRRGFVEGIGWAHGIAHAADAVDDIVQCPELTASDLKLVLESLRDVLCVEDCVYTHMEEDRICFSVIEIIKRELLSDEEFKDWISSFSEAVLHVESVPEKYTIRTNAKNFLQTLYFRLAWEDFADRFNQTIEETIREISLFAK